MSETHTTSFGCDYLIDDGSNIELDLTSTHYKTVLYLSENDLREMLSQINIERDGRNNQKPRFLERGKNNLV